MFSAGYVEIQIFVLHYFHFKYAVSLEFVYIKTA